MSEFFGATNIVMIQKMDVPEGFTQIFPISLYSVVYKIMAKIMVFRLAPILEKKNSLEQTTFIRGRSTFL